MCSDGRSDELLPCEMVECLWNTINTDDEGNLSVPPADSGAYCTYTVSAPVLGLPIPDSCPHRSTIEELLSASGAGRELGIMPAEDRLARFISAKASEARERLGLLASESLRGPESACGIDQMCQAKAEEIT